MANTATNKGDKDTIVFPPIIQQSRCKSYCVFPLVDTASSIAAQQSRHCTEVGVFTTATNNRDRDTLVLPPIIQQSRVDKSCLVFPHVDLTPSNTAKQSEHCLDVQVLKEVGLLKKPKKNRNYKTIVEWCQKNSTNFIDVSFPPTRESLFGATDNRTSQSVVWKRAQDVVPFDDCKLEWTIYRDKPTPDDILQGLIGNCGFVAALTLLIGHLDKIILNKSISNEGIYQICFCIEGKWKAVIIDDYLPCDRTWRLHFSKAKRKQLWVPLIEKALAKVKGSYAALHGCYLVEALLILTGAPCERVRIPGDAASFEVDEKNVTILWETLEKYKEKRYVIGATSCKSACVNVRTGNRSKRREDSDKADDRRYEEVGLQRKHGYSLLDMAIVDGERLVKLRNPNGSVEWNGPWSNDSSLWISDRRTRLRPQVGTFWLPLYEFCRYFDAIEMCKLEKESMEVRFRTILPPHCKNAWLHAIELRTDEETEVDIILYQTSINHDKKTSKYRPLEIMLIIVDKELVGMPKMFQYCSQKIGRQCNGSHTHTFVRGSYLILTLSFNHWGEDFAPNEIPRCIVALHSLKSIAAEKQLLVVEPSFIADSLISMILTEGEKNSLDKIEFASYFITVMAVSVIVMVENFSPDYSLHVSCNLNKFSNMKSTRGSLQTTDVVPPMRRQILTFDPQLQSQCRSLLKFCKSKKTHLVEFAPEETKGSEISHWPPITEDISGLHQPTQIT